MQPYIERWRGVAAETRRTLLETETMSSLKSRRVAALGVGIALALGAAGVSYAVEQAPRQTQPNAQAAQPNQDRQTDRRQRIEDRMRDRLEGRLGYLHSALKITQAQERLWTDFANAVRDQERDFAMRVDRGRDQIGRRDRDRGEPSVVDRLERRQQQLANESQQMNRLLTTLRPLYAALSPEQKQLADENLFHPERQRFAGMGRFRGDRDGNYYGDGRFGGDRFYGDRFGRGPGGAGDRFGGPYDRF